MDGFRDKSYDPLPQSNGLDKKPSKRSKKV